MKNTSKTLAATILLFASLMLTGCAGGSESESKPNQTNTSSTQSSSPNNTQSTVDRDTQSVIKNTQSASDDSTQSAPESSEDETNGVNFDGFKISIDTERPMSTYTIDNQFSELNERKVYAVPMIIENTSDETKGINLFYVTAFGASGTELDSVYAYFTEAQDFYKEMRPGAKIQTAYYMLDDGSGEYYIVFKSFAEEKELKVNIA